MNIFQKTGLALKTVYSEKKYFFITFLFAFFIYAMNVFIMNASLITKNFSLTLYLLLLTGFKDTMYLSGWILLILITILGGVVLSMTIHMIKLQIKSGLASSTSGVLMGIIAPACPSCALGLASTLGVGGLLVWLPFGGLELSYLAIVLLVFSVFYLSNKLTSTCNLEMKYTDEE